MSDDDLNLPDLSDGPQGVNPDPEPMGEPANVAVWKGFSLVF